MKSRKETLLKLNRTLQILAVSLASVADSSVSYALGDKLLYHVLPSNMSVPVTNPCVNPYEADYMPWHIPAGLTQSVHQAFVTKLPPYDVTIDDIFTPLVLINVAIIAILHEIHWNSILHLTRERERNRQAFCHQIVDYWATDPAHHQPTTRQY